MKTMSPVYHAPLDELVGTTWDGYDKALEAAHAQMLKDNLYVHVVVLAHGTDASRIASTTAMLNMLSDEVRSDRIQLWLSYQGKKLPTQLRKYAADNSIQTIDQTDEQPDIGLPMLPKIGKTENILRALKAIHDANVASPEQQFVIFLDNDYLLYDAVNVHSLYLPWVMDKYKDNGVARNDLYIKAGGMRLKLSKALQDGDPLRVSGKPAKFIDLCKVSLTQAGFDASILDASADLIPTRETLLESLGESVVDDLDTALDVTTRQGARSSRGLSCYLQARRDNPIARFFSEFSFLLHGDQGTSLANWMKLSLSPGYGLELAYLHGAMEHAGGAVVNVIGLPHAHHPKGETENFLLGIEMFSLAMELIDGSPTPKQQTDDDTWAYFSPTKLGLKKVTIQKPERTDFYPALETMLH